MGDVARPFRPIAPRTFPPGGGGGHQPPTGGGPPEDGRMKRASTACKECQKRRTRCSGLPTCSECQAHGRDCIFDELSDKRRKAAARKTQEELDSLRTFLDDLLGVFRDFDPDSIHVQHVVDTIRSGGSNDAIRNAILEARSHLQPTRPSHHPMEHQMINDQMSPYYDPR
ncbi:uncharacterized protein N7483_008534 [Penicillium malachiteum]|uniref:uncharacterized protein n=1 Tax=Penicillium malachiteum TaxID=1324776 RepID=UPI0025476F96|nr:uncharacterized protein N7483_008534 [Penicillium malachiteum]KAJ5720600.1 hypothetical protein N7483_008534 [Penicillium malachiteum]